MNDQNRRSGHSIRLDSVWQPPVAATSSWTRSFGAPGGIEPTDRVFLVIERPAVAAMMLNGVSMPSPLPGASRWERDVTDLLEPRNVLQLQSAVEAGRLVPHTIDAHGRARLPEQIGRVSLEILTLLPDDR